MSKSRLFEFLKNVSLIPGGSNLIPGVHNFKKLCTCYSAVKYKGAKSV